MFQQAAYPLVRKVGANRFAAGDDIDLDVSARGRVGAKFRVHPDVGLL